MILSTVIKLTYKVLHNHLLLVNTANNLKITLKKFCEENYVYAHLHKDHAEQDFLV